MVNDLFNEIITRGAEYGRGDGMRGRCVLVEFVSANPNGPLTIGHGRGGALGAALAGAAGFAGAEATREFYVNDASNSRQMARFAQAVRARLSASSEGGAGRLDDGGYPEEYVTRIAEALAAQFAGKVPDLKSVQAAAAALVRGEQEQILRKFGLTFDNWFSEADLHARGTVAQTVRRLRDSGFAFEQGGALWLRSTAFGDDDDRTLVRADGTPTYLAGDLAYHADKFARGYDLLIDVWSADHAGYVERTRAGLAALGYDPARLKIVLHGPVRFLRDGTEVRGGQFGGAVTLEDALEEIPAPAARLMLLRVPAEVPLDLDGDLAERKDRANPMWRVREALGFCVASPHPRLLSKRPSPADGRGGIDAPVTLASLVPPLPSAGEGRLESKRGWGLATALAAFPDVVRRAAESLWPHHVTDWTLDFADRILSAAATGGLSGPAAHASRIALTNALDLLGISRENDADVQQVEDDV